MAWDESEKAHFSSPNYFFITTTKSYWPASLTSYYTQLLLFTGGYIARLLGIFGKKLIILTSQQ
jgi:hypothetical protein